MFVCVSVYMSLSASCVSVTFCRSAHSRSREFESKTYFFIEWIEFRSTEPAREHIFEYAQSRQPWADNHVLQSRLLALSPLTISIPLSSSRRTGKKAELIERLTGKYEWVHEEKRERLFASPLPLRRFALPLFRLQILSNTVHIYKLAIRINPSMLALQIRQNKNWFPMIFLEKTFDDILCGRF